MKLSQILVLVTYFGMVIVNGLANALPLNGITTGEISDQFPVLFTPAGYVFSIWGLIYLLLLGFSVYQALPAQRDQPRLEGIRPWFILSNLLNGAWIFLWHYGFFALTLVVMLGLLGTLIWIYTRLGTGLTQVTLAERVLVQLPFSVYLGWISVATVANASATLYDLGWNGGAIAPEIWTVVMLLVAASLGVAMTLLRRDYAYTSVLVWAFAGIYVSQAETQVVAYTAAAAAAGLVVLMLIHFLRGKFNQNQVGALREQF